MATPFPFTASTVLTAAQLNAIGESVAFTPAFSSITIGNGTRSGTYVQVNKTVYFQAKVTFGSTTTLAANTDLTLPVAASGVTTLDSINFTGIFFDSSASVFNLMYAIMIGTTAVRLLAITTTGTYAGAADTSATIPFTWATSDTITVAGNYQVA